MKQMETLMAADKKWNSAIKDAEDNPTDVLKATLFT